MQSHFPLKSAYRNLFSNCLFILFFIILLSGCSKDDSGSEPDNQVDGFSLNNDELRPLQIVSAHFSEETLSSSEYFGSISDVELTFYRVNSNTLAFVVPEGVSTGSVKLKVQINKTIYAATANILENITLTDPKQVYENFYQKYSTHNFFIVDKQMLDAAKARFDSLSEDEKRLAAQMLLNNEQFLENLNIALSNFYSGFTNSDTSQMKMAQLDKLSKVGLAVAVVGAVISSPAVAAVGAGIAVGLALEVVIDSFNIIMDAAMPKVTQALEMTYGLGFDRMAYTTELVYDEAERRIFNKQQEIPERIILREKEMMNLSIQLITTPLVSDEYRKDYSVVEQLLNSISTMREMLSGYYEIPAPPQKEFKQFAESLENFTVSVDNPDVEVSELSGTPENASVYFETEEMTDQDFTFTYAYTNEEGEATSLSQEMKLDVGFSVVFLNGSEVPNPLEWTNNTSRSFKIVDYKGDDLENFEITKLSVQSVSSSEVYFQAQKNGIFNGNGPGDYFEIIPLTDEEEIEVNFELVYDGTVIQTIYAVVKARNPLIGTWKPKTYMGKPLGTAVYYYAEECPELETFREYKYSETLTFTEETFTWTAYEVTINLNRTYRIETCEILSDDPDTEEIKNTNESGTYMFSDNTFTVYFDGNPDDSQSGQIQFLNEEKTQFILVGDPYNDIYEKQVEN